MQPAADNNQEQVRPTTGGAAGVLMFSILLIAVIHLLVFHIGQDAPIWRFNSPDWPQRQIELVHSNTDTLFRRAAAGGNVALHFVGPPSTPSDELIPSQYYYRGVYELYPRTVFIGREDRIINSTGDLASNDVLTDDAWLAAHDVRSVLTFDRANHAPPFIRPIQNPQTEK